MEKEKFLTEQSCEKRRKRFEALGNLSRVIAKKAISEDEKAFWEIVQKKAEEKALEKCNFSTKKVKEGDS